MRIALVDAIREFVHFGSYVWAVTDPETEVGISPVADVPEHVLAELPRLIRLRYLTTVNRWSMDRTSASLHEATEGELSRSLLHREVLGPHGVGDVATVIFRDQHGLWGWLDLWRSPDQAPFSAADLDTLAALAPVITSAFRRCHARTFELPAALPVRPGPVVLMLSPDLEVKVQTPATDAYLRALLPPDADRRPVPAGAYNVGAQLIAIEAGIDDHPASSRVRLRDGIWLTFRAARVEDGEDIAVSIEPCSPDERLSLFARSHALTPRETQLLELLVDGADTRAVAEKLFLSEHTVQDHLKSIFDKTGARNRRTLLARITGRVAGEG